MDHLTLQGMTNFLSTLACLICFVLHSQKEIIPIRIRFSDSSLVLNKVYSDSILGEIRITKLKMYLSDSNAKQNYLIDLEDSILPSFHAKANKLSLCFGTDSLLNVSGIHNGIYDPLYGMYWAWNSGFINFKLEGICSTCKGKNGKFEYHIGGYLSPHSTAQNFAFKILETTNFLDFDIKLLLEKYAINGLSSILTPGEDAVEFAQEVVATFRIGNE